MREKLLDLEDMSTEILNQAEGLRAVLNAFDSEFTMDRDPENLALAVRANPKTFQFLIFVAENIVSDIIKRAEAMQDLAGA